jgi:hypothetical protein
VSVIQRTSLCKRGFLQIRDIVYLLKAEPIEMCRFVPDGDNVMAKIPIKCADVCYSSVCIVQSAFQVVCSSFQAHYPHVEYTTLIAVFLNSVKRHTGLYS